MITCPRCRGGAIEYDRCSLCHGTGETSRGVARRWRFENVDLPGRPYWSEHCDECGRITPHHHVDSHTRHLGENGNRHVKHDRTKKCSICRTEIATIEIPRDMLPAYAAAMEGES